jgi:hypothetical protein
MEEYFNDSISVDKITVALFLEQINKMIDKGELPLNAEVGLHYCGIPVHMSNVGIGTNNEGSKSLVFGIHIESLTMAVSKSKMKQMDKLMNQEHSSFADFLKGLRENAEG